MDSDAFTLFERHINPGLAGLLRFTGLDRVEAHAEGPYVGATGFSVKFRMDIKDNSTGRRTIMEEIGVYTVFNGKIIQEEFMYGSMTPAEAAHPDPLGTL